MKEITEVLNKVSNLGFIKSQLAAYVGQIESYKEQIIEIETWLENSDIYPQIKHLLNEEDEGESK